jgi:hypothetical protein
MHHHPDTTADFDDNQLHQLGNQAIQQGLIIGHGYHQGQYEILHRTETVLLSPQEAVIYLQELLTGNLGEEHG